MLEMSFMNIGLRNSMKTGIRHSLAKTGYNTPIWLLGIIPSKYVLAKMDFIHR